VKKHSLSFVLLLASSAFAAIGDVQNNANFACTLSPCTVILNTQSTTTGNLIAVWTFWQSSSGSTASVSDSVATNKFVSAVGPTQSASSTPITAQMFYARNITGTTFPTKDTVTVTFTGSISLAGVVAVEYSGLDHGNPLDDVSAGYSNSGSPGSMFDSGWAPLGLVPLTTGTNQNVLIFGAAVADASGTPTPGTNFTLVQSNGTSLGLCGLTEEHFFQAGGSVFQHAPSSCGSGNWLAQMAVFRSATWTVAGGWSPVRPYLVYDATQFSGTDPCAQTKTAIETPTNGTSSPIVDSRGFVNAAIPCANPPFQNSDTGVLYLPSGQLQTQNTWTIGGSIQLIGTGRGMHSGTTNTSIQLQTGSSGTSATPQFLVQQNTGSPALTLDTEIQHAGIDCNNQTGSEAIQSDLSQDRYPGVRIFRPL
jgi:hypothetical protein